MSTYTASEVNQIRAAEPLTYEAAATLADKLGKTHRSVIAKAKSLGVEYIPKAAPAKKSKGLRKADLVLQIESVVQAELPGLDKASAKALDILARYVLREPSE